MTNLLLIQPSSFCNINCDYCYVPSRLDRSKVDFDFIETTFKKVFASSQLEDDFLIGWHVGEPLSLGISFYEQAFDIIDKLNTSGKRYQHAMQTNATLINSEWTDFFRRHCVSVGISLDGPCHIHDAHRKTWSNEGTFSSAMRGVGFMKKAGLPLRALCVVTAESLACSGAELFNFFLEAGFSWLGLNVESPWGEHSKTSFSGSHDRAREEEFEASYRLFLGELYDAWLPHRSSFHIREFSDMLTSFKSLQHDSNAFVLNAANIPCKTITIGRQGDITTFSPEMLSGTPDDQSRFVVGNICQLETLDQVRALPAHGELEISIGRGVQRCREECSYFSVCGGGNPSSKYYEHGTFDCTQTRDCRYSVQILAEVLIAKIRKKTDAHL